jgi:hypothetical protein
VKESSMLQYEFSSLGEKSDTARSLREFLRLLLQSSMLIEGVHLWFRTG